MTKSFTVIDKDGLHARPVSLLTKKASVFPNSINIEYNGKKVTLKSMLFVMSLGIAQGATFTLEVLGDNEEMVMQELESILVEEKLI